MKYEFSACLCQVAISHAETGAFGIKKYERCKEPTYLKIAAYGVRQLTYYSMLAYCVAHEIDISLTPDFDNLVSFVSKRCENGGFLKLPLASLWEMISETDSCKPDDMSWDEFCDQLTDFARAVQDFYNEQLVPKVREFNPDERHGDVERQRLTNFR